MLGITICISGFWLLILLTVADRMMDNKVKEVVRLIVEQKLVIKYNGNLCNCYRIPISYNKISETVIFKTIYVDKYSHKISSTFWKSHLRGVIQDESEAEETESPMAEFYEIMKYGIIISFGSYKEEIKKASN